jgi:hypothetical protein
VLLVTTRQKILNLDTLFSSKERCSASKTAISGTTGQHGPCEACRHQSTQVRCDVGSGTNLHRTVTRQSGRINPEILDDGTHPTSQDFFHLPARTTWYNAVARLVYLQSQSQNFFHLLTRFTRFTTHAQGLLYFTNYHIHDYGDFRLYNKTLDEAKQHTRRIFIGRVVHIDRSTNRTSLTTDSVKR